MINKFIILLINNNISSYDIIDLSIDLKETLKLINGKKTSDSVLSSYLGQEENYIRYTKKNYKRNPFFKLSFQEVQEFKLNLRKKLGIQLSFLIKSIRKYKKNNILKIGKNKIYDYHPNFVENYFLNINSKEKAYWFGFIYADGTLGYKHGVLNRKGEKYLRFRFGLSPNKIDNIYIIKKFVKTLGLDEKVLKNINFKSKSVKIYKKVGFEISSQIFCRNLIFNGVIVGEEKTSNIQFPDLKKSELDLAFIFGFFDGDGTSGTTTITSASKKFLEHIRKKYNIKHNLRKTKGKAWRLSLGAKLFNNLIDNYKNSLIRKRRYFETMEQRSLRMKKFNSERNKYI